MERRGKKSHNGLKDSKYRKMFKDNLIDCKAGRNSV